MDRRVTFVTFANFTETAQTRSIEIGTLIRCARFAGHFKPPQLLNG